MKIALLQPLIPHYRKAFFQQLKEKFDIDLYVYESNETIKNKGMHQTDLEYIKLTSTNFAKKITIYNFLPLMHKEYDILILPGELRSLSTWLLLFIFKLSKRRIILWGHGISVKHYLKEEKKLSKIRVLFHNLADSVWLYTKKEKEIWSKYIDDDKIIALNNSIDTKKILSLPPLNKEEIKKKYKIATKVNLIYCARFTANRRIDLMLDLIQVVENDDIGIVIIGGGDYKPDFTKYKNVHDFGTVYDEGIKHELFTISDLYFQPAWTGLSIVEAMAYGKPIFTLERSDSVLQCVEYGYIKNGLNGFIGKDINEIVFYLKNMTKEALNEMQTNTKEYAKSNFGIEVMVKKAKKDLNRLINDH